MQEFSEEDLSALALLSELSDGDIAGGDDGGKGKGGGFGKACGKFGCDAGGKFGCKGGGKCGGGPDMGGMKGGCGPYGPEGMDKGGMMGMMKGKGMDKGAMMAMMKGKMMAIKGKAAAKGIVPPWQQPQQNYGGIPGYQPGMYMEEPGGYVGIEGLKDAVTRACDPHVALETKWKRDEMINKLCMSIFKTASKWWKEDTRHKENGTAIQAQALLEEFTEKIMGALSSTCHEKPWFLEIYLSESIALAAINVLKGGALFKRTVAPIIVTHVDEAIFRFREEERHARVMWDAVSSLGLKADYQKKANKHLQTSFEGAHISAKYGQSLAASPELGMCQDFVHAWMSEFLMRAWDVLHNGIPNSDQAVQISFVTLLFQYLCDPAHSCLPHDLTQNLPNPPPPQWDFVQQAAILLFSQQ